MRGLTYSTPRRTARVHRTAGRRNVKIEENNIKNTLILRLNMILPTVQQVELKNRRCVTHLTITTALITPRPSEIPHYYLFNTVNFFSSAKRIHNSHLRSPMCVLRMCMYFREKINIYVKHCRPCMYLIYIYDHFCTFCINRQYSRHLNITLLNIIGGKT